MNDVKNRNGILCVTSKLVKLKRKKEEKRRKKNSRCGQREVGENWNQQKHITINNKQKTFLRRNKTRGKL